MQREIRLTPILLLVLGVTTVLVLGLILLLWAFLPPTLQSGLPFAISTVVLVNTALLRVIPVLGKRLAGDDSLAAQKQALANAQPYYNASAPAAYPPQQYAAPVVPAATHTCRRCGKVSQPGDAFCRQCGSSLSGPIAASHVPVTPAMPAAAYPAHAPVVSGARPAAPPDGMWAGGGPVTSVGGMVAVSPPVHRFLSKRALRNLLFIGTAFNLVAGLIYFFIGLIVNACSGGTSDVSACAPPTADYLSVLLILALVIWLPGIVLVLLANVFALIRTAMVRRWGWFVAILVSYLFLWNVAMFLYVFVGPEHPPASQLPGTSKPLHR